MTYSLLFIYFHIQIQVKNLVQQPISRPSYKVQCMELINALLFQYVVQELQMYVVPELQDLQPNNSEV